MQKNENLDAYFIHDRCISIFKYFTKKYWQFTENIVRFLKKNLNFLDLHYVCVSNTVDSTFTNFFSVSVELLMDSF